MLHCFMFCMKKGSFMNNYSYSASSWEKKPGCGQVPLQPSAAAVGEKIAAPPLKILGPPPLEKKSCRGMSQCT